MNPGVFILILCGKIEMSEDFTILTEVLGKLTEVFK